MWTKFKCKQIEINEQVFKMQLMTSIQNEIMLAKMCEV